MSFTRKLLRFLLLVVLAAFIGWYIGFLSQVKEITPLKKTSNNNSSSEENGRGMSQPVRKFPELQDPRDIDYRWVYNGKDYSLKITLYQSVYDFYRSSPKEYSYTGTLPANWEEDYYGMFVRSNPVDRTVSELAKLLEGMASKNRLSEDQKVELVTAFVQSIPYDDAKADLIEQGDEQVKPLYPYELLYENKGVCSEKSFLLKALLKEMGYGTVLFEYKEAKHIAVGVKCPPDFSSYASGYCYTETTQPGHRIGVIPDLGKDNNVAVVKEEMSNFGQEENPVEIKKLGSPKLFNREEGRVYSGIVYTIKTQDKITKLEEEIAVLKNELKPLKEETEKQGESIDKLTEKMNKLKKDKQYEAYNGLVSDYNDKVGEYKKQSNDYNKKVSVYNQKVNQYNKLIREFYD